MIQTFSEEKPPRKPREYENLTICEKDFEHYKKLLEINQLKDTKFDTTSLFREMGADKNFIEFHTMFSRHLKKLIKNEKEDVAFSHFQQSFPACLPNRTHLRTLFDSFKNF
ncbi:MAG: hypothetical protein ACFFAO_16990 [Candidatus Hermodarchaeota archaeon]